MTYGSLRQKKIIQILHISYALQTHDMKQE